MNMARLALCFFSLYIFSGSVSAQLDFRPLLNQPSFADGWARGQREALEKEKLRQETERLRLENEQRRRQLEESRRLADLQAQQELNKKQSDEEVIKRWFAAAQPRASRYVDFNEVVFAPDVRLTIPMIQIMSESRYAADIAYFLGGDKKIALQISLMDPPTARAEISKIEGVIRDRELLEMQEELRKLRATLAQMEASRKDGNPLADSQRK